MSLPKPSKKILILIVCAVALIIVLSINKFYKKHESPIIKAEQFQNTTPAQSLKVDSALLDTDEDGLPDWQEIITGTDPKKKDSDSDGTNDGKELELGRNPTIKGPNDQTENAPIGTTTPSNTTPGTVSDTVAKNLFANAVYMSANGEITEESKQSLVDNLISGIQKSFVYKEYTAEGLVTIQVPSINDLRFYASNFATLQVGMILQMQKNIARIEKDVSVLGEIYAKQASDLYTLQVPLELKDIHLKIVNNYSKGATVFETIANEKKDPMKLPFAIKTYQDIVVDQPLLLKRISQFVRNNDIIFTNNEAGGYWNAFE